MRIDRAAGGCSMLAIVLAVASVQADDPIRFGRDVLPILSANCFACHGPDETVRQAGLRLDIEADAKAPHDGGIPVAPGDVASSTLIERITSSDPDLVMPPPDSHKSLQGEQIETLRRWVAEGAAWGKHWSFEPIERPARELAAGESAIDRLVEESLKKKGLSLRPQAAGHTLVRRLHLDLIGLPPSVEAADAFAANPSEAAWEAMVDELLARPQFGEHWARMWMDLARYADTKGYEKDLGRTMWPYRDWLVRSLNADMPLDRMTIEQLAGDLLPEATIDQRIATAFHRQTMSNDEGGTDDEEFRTIAVKDRVDTTLQVWMGLTAGCAKCHSHKYDPLSQTEYYRLFAIFNQTEDADRYDDAPLLEVATPEVIARREAADKKLADLKAELASARKEDADRQNERWRTLPLMEASSQGGAMLTGGPDGAVVVSGASPAEDVYTLKTTLPAGKHTVLRIQALSDLEGQPAGVGRNPRDPNFVLSELEVELAEGEAFRRLTLVNPRADFEQDGWPVKAALDGDTKTGWAISPRQKEDHAALFDLAKPLELASDGVLRITLRQHYGDSLTLRRFRLATIGEPAETVKLQEKSPKTGALEEALAALEQERRQIDETIPRIPVMRSLESDKRRETRIHRRGNFLDPGETVTAGLPAAFAFSPTSREGELDRLALAQWLMSADNTLTPRVWANRIWARLFGTGIVETEEDFGALGAPPVHPQLLDWLAAEYRDNGWSLKRLLKSIVTSRTYRQASDTPAELRQLDPRNLLLSRGARFRLSAEAIRDQSLAAAGLLSLKMGGPPVMPPQPDGLWRSTYNGQKWINAEGEDRFRRALYTYLKRTTPYPSMTTFDGGSGEVCQIRRIRTNTPLQALVSLNDPVYLEAAGALAARMANHPGDKAEFGLRTALIRPLREGETAPLLRLQREVQAALEASPGEAAGLIASSRASPPAGMSEAEFASWIVVASTILNLDEFLSRN